jgi:membrane associated rhomboid family serine protease
MTERDDTTPTKPGSEETLLHHAESGAFSDVPPPEDFLPSPPKPVGPFRRWPPLFPAFTAPLCVALGSLGLSLLHWNRDLSAFAASGYDVWQQGRYWKLFTALLDHADIAHWGLNMMPLVFFGWLLCAYFGVWVFILGALFVGLTSNAFTIALYQPATSLIGASGVVYGIIAMWLVLYIRFDNENNLAKKCMRVVGFVLMLLFPTTYEHTTSYLAHASGFVFGIFAGASILPFVTLRIFPANEVELRPFIHRSFRVRRTRHGNSIFPY